MDVEAAIEMASSKNLDLVKIAPLANPPVCKIMDYGKYMFEQAKKEKEAKKKQKLIDIKEVRLSVHIGENDFNTKLKNAIKFLKAKNKVKAVVRLRGREMARSSVGFELLDKFKTACEDYGTIDRPSKLEGRSVVCIIAPKTTENKA